MNGVSDHSDDNCTFSGKDSGSLKLLLRSFAQVFLPLRTNHFYCCLGLGK